LKKKIIAIIPVRGGSKGIPCKNLLDFCGHPLVTWSITQALSSRMIDSVWVSSDDKDILRISEEYGAKIVLRPLSISGDQDTSESAWIHAIDAIEKEIGRVDFILGMQATSPIRESADLDKAITLMKEQNLDSLMSVTEIEDFFTWKKNKSNEFESVNYDYRCRKRRQEVESRYLENGSFYIFKPEILRNNNNRLGGKIGVYLMDMYKMFQIDNHKDVHLCECIMRGYKLNYQEKII
jgi:CMP-N,N'-diacetyllegionaminic acid synthase